MTKQYNRTVTFRQVDKFGNVRQKTFNYRRFFISILAVIWIALSLYGLLLVMFVR